MAHAQQSDFCLSVKQRHPAFFRDRLVLDIGSLDINGNNQHLFENCHYLGVDLQAGRNVDLASPGHLLGLPSDSIDTIISTECFEHDLHYAETLRNIVRMLKPGGLLVFTCATTGRPEHGTRRTSPADAPFLQAQAGGWSDYYRNLDESDIRAVLDVERLFQSFAFSTCEATHDLYFWGLKAGATPARTDYSFQIAPHSRNETLLRLHDHVAALNDTIAELHRAAVEQNRHFQQLTGRMMERDQQLEHHRARLAESRARLRAMEGSRSWRLTAPLRRGAAALRHLKTLAARAAQLGVVSLRYLLRGDVTGLARRVHHRLRLSAAATPLSEPMHDAATPGATPHWGILTTPHTYFVAQLLCAQLRRHGWTVRLFTSSPTTFELDGYFVLCAQMFDRLPPGPKRVVYQMEQCVSSRWFTPAYLQVLRESRAVLDYAQTNIAFLATHGVAYPHVYYLPVGASGAQPGLDAHSPTAKTHDLLFYGDVASSPRRQRMLAALQERFDVAVINGVFHPQIARHIRCARVVVNLHYYEDALLETTRINECLTLGTPVVSESTADSGEYPELGAAVRFFPHGDIAAMLDCVAAALADTQLPRAVGSAVLHSGHRFAFMFDRFLIGAGLLPRHHARQLSLPSAAGSGQVVLSLPETQLRRRAFLSARPDGCDVFDGLRHQPGWMGCAMSYRALARHALAHGHTMLTVMEDDVSLPADYPAALRAVHDYLESRHGQWDLFAGLIASLHPDTRVLHAETRGATTFVTIDRMTSMVFNIYGMRALHLLADWDDHAEDPATNTIDRYLERQDNLRAVVTLPFFVGHREDLSSTLWGFDNDQYTSMIEASEAMLRLKVEAWHLVQRAALPAAASAVKAEASLES